jgi:hypothetical protein
MIGEGDCGAIGGMKNGRGNRSTYKIYVGLKKLKKRAQQRVPEP